MKRQFIFNPGNATEAGGGAPESVKTFEYPKSITLDGKTYEVDATPELKSFFTTVVNTSAQIEKNKLYPTLNKTKQELSAAEVQMKQLMELYDEQLKRDNAKQEELQRQMREQERQQIQGANYEQLLSKMEERFTSILNERLGETATRVAKLEYKDVQEYITAKQNELEGKAITDMIGGSTIQDVDASIELATQAFNRLVEKGIVKTEVTPAAPVVTSQETPVATPVAEPQPVAQPVTVPVVAQPAQPQAAATPVATPQQQSVVPAAPTPTPTIPVYETGIPDLKSMTQQDFNKNRDVLFQQIQAVANAHMQQYGTTAQ